VRRPYRAPMISIVSYQIFAGPNTYAPAGTLVVRLALDDSDGSKLIAAMASLEEVSCGWWTRPERIEGEVWKLYTARLLAGWTLAALNKRRGYLHHCGTKMEENGKISLWLDYHNPKTSFDALSLGIRLLKSFAEGHAEGLHASKNLENLWQQCRATHPDYQARFLMEAAACKNVPYSPFFSPMRLWQFGWGRRALKFFESSSEEDSSIGLQIAKNKVVSKKILGDFGAPVQRHVLVRQSSELETAAAEVGWPCVLKPIDRGQAKGVTVNIRSMTQLRAAFDGARAFSEAPLMVEAMAPGDVYRLLVVRGRLMAVSRRRPARILADGRSTVLELTEAFNRARTVGATPESYRGAVPIDAEFDTTLTEQGLMRETVPPAGQSITLRTIPLLGTGADNEDVTGQIHQDTRALAESVAESLGLAIVGFDYLTPEITQSCKKFGTFLELNTTPSLRGHMVNDQDVHGIAMAVLGPLPARLPSVLIVAPAELTENMIEPCAASIGLGWRTGDAVGIGALQLKLETRTPAAAFFALASHKRVERIIFACTAEELMQHGMVIDRPDLVLADFEALEGCWADVLRLQAGETRSLPAATDLADALFPYLSGAEQ